MEFSRDKCNVIWLLWQISPCKHAENISDICINFTFWKPYLIELDKSYVLEEKSKSQILV